jgi:Ca2+-binding EF-hand superfamily protein
VEERNVVEDYRRAFGSDPPARATLGIMNDSDNTKEASVAYVGFIEIYR